MADLASKRVTADNLRAELDALRTARENKAQVGHEAAQEVALDVEVERLREEVKRERMALEASGSVDDAAAIMAAAAAESEEVADDEPVVTELVAEPITESVPQPADSDMIVPLTIEETVPAGGVK